MNNLEKNIHAVAIDAAKQVAREDFEILGRKLIAHCDAYKTRPEADTKVCTVMAYLAEFFAEAFNIPQPKPIPLQRRKRVETKSLLWDSRERQHAAQIGSPVFVRSEFEEGDNKL